MLLGEGFQPVAPAGGRQHFLSAGAQSRIVQHRVRQHPLEPRVLVLKRRLPQSLLRVEPAELAFHL